MSDYCILVADAVRARIFTLEPAAFPTDSGPRLVEQQTDFVNPEESISGRQLWGETRPGGSHSASGEAHGYDDHREQHMEENRRRFARQVAAQAIRHAIDHHTKTLVVAAEAHMMGLLREALDIPAKSQIKLVEVAKDFSKFSAQEIHHHLAEEQVLPPVKRPEAG